MWYSSPSYQTSPNGYLPVPHFASEKSSVKDAGRFVLEFILEALVFELAFALRLETLELEFEAFAIRFELVPMLPRAKIMITRPIPIIPTTTIPPRTHQTAFDFLRGVP